MSKAAFCRKKEGTLMRGLMKPLSTDIGWLGNDLRRLFGAVSHTINPLDEFMTGKNWSPAVDISENEKRIEIKADLPEVKKEDIEVSVDDGMLTISGERKHEHEDKEGDVHHIERSYGSYERSFALPENVDTKKITADCKDGVLTLTLPKSAKKSTSHRKIKIS
jgi:HSP20 family protein